MNRILTSLQYCAIALTCAACSSREHRVIPSTFVLDDCIKAADSKLFGILSTKYNLADFHTAYGDCFAACDKLGFGNTAHEWARTHQDHPYAFQVYIEHYLYDEDDSTVVTILTNYTPDVTASFLPVEYVLADRGKFELLFSAHAATGGKHAHYVADICRKACPEALFNDRYMLTDDQIIERANAWYHQHKDKLVVNCMYPQTVFRERCPERLWNELAD